MSRTVRIKDKDIPPWVYGYWKKWYPNMTIKKFMSIFHKDGEQHFMNTPSWWHTEMHTRPKRVRTRIQIQKVYTLIDYEDAEEFPLDKKPHIYYW